MLAREDDGKLGDKAGKQVVDYLRTQSEKKKGVSGAEAALKLGKRTAKVADQTVELWPVAVSQQYQSSSSSTHTLMVSS